MNKPSLISIKSAFFGLCIGDALGVPVEFKSRQELKSKPISDMIGYGTYMQAPGTWSDDSSLTFCLAESLCQGYNITDIASSFLKWYRDAHWTAHDEVFDIGLATRKALHKIESGSNPIEAGGKEELDNGNGSLMRILPLAFYFHDQPLHEQFKIIKQVSSITHAHMRSILACFYYLEFVKSLLNQKDKFQAYSDLSESFKANTSQLLVGKEELNYFDRLLNGKIFELPESEIRSTGYVIHSLEASIWCLMTTENYKSAVLKAVNLGEDTDTTAAITGGLAGILYGFESIPKKWFKSIARSKDIDALCIRFHNSLK